MPFDFPFRHAPPPPEPGLLFHLSAERGFTADYAAGDAHPNFLSDVTLIRDGARGPAFRCGESQAWSYWAPGNIYAQRGTLAFFWRSQEPMGKTPFPLFRVAYADHSSWEMVWLRMDYNGNGFDAFVSDINLARVRVSTTMPGVPKPGEWAHLALAWDETRGVRFYVNGKLAAKKDAVVVFYAGLDQFGPHSRNISPIQVHSAAQFVRPGDIDELRIYDRMLSDANVAALARAEPPGQIPPLARDLGQPEWRAEWWLRYGWNRPGDAPPYLEAPEISVRKVEIHEVYDLKRWWWKATDGIRETTWPGLHNRSRLPGHSDYFMLPDADCYSTSGKTVTFTLPEEPWNHLEISGAAWGKMSLLAWDREGARHLESALFERPKGQERTFHRWPLPFQGHKLRFQNVEQETPIGELSAYHVHPGKEPHGSARLAYTLTAKAEPDNANLRELLGFIRNRYAEDERSIMVALPPGAPRTQRAASTSPALPLVHVLIPCGFRDESASLGQRNYSYTWENIDGGLDGVALDLPPLPVKATHGDLFPLNLQVKDPLWPHRNLLDFSFSVKPDEARTLWLDLRDRILPNGKSLYLTLAGAGPDFSAAALEGAQLRLIFKPRRQAAPEHELDRFTQVRDSFSHLVEPRPNSRRFNLFRRFETDITDLLRINPDHELGRLYWYEMNREQPRPAFSHPAPPAGTPLWAFRQVEALRRFTRVVLWWIDHRQIDSGEFGGGLGDDGDLTNMWPPAAFMGCQPDKIKNSLAREMEAVYQQGMIQNGIQTLRTDDLHAYEEGLQILGQSLLLDYGNPKYLERAFETARGLERLTGINAAGHRHFRTFYFSNTFMAEEGPWEWSRPTSYLILHPVLMLVGFNGNPAAKKLVLELADGLLAHRKQQPDGRYAVDISIHFRTDEGKPGNPGIPAANRGWPFWPAWRWTGDAKYLAPLSGGGARARPSRASPAGHFAWLATGDKRHLEELYAGMIETAAAREYLNTEGSLWSDRIVVPNEELQRARLGGVALVRGSTYPEHLVSWKFAPPASDQSVAILLPRATPEEVKILACNLDSAPVNAVLTAWDVEPGQWELVEGIDANGDDVVEKTTATRLVALERGAELALRLAPRTTTVLTLKLKSRETPYWARPDLGISRDDVKVEGRLVRVKVHSLGSVEAPAATASLRAADGRVLSTAPVPPLPAPLDLRPKTVEITLTVPSGASLRGAEVRIEVQPPVREITARNNAVRL